MTKFAVHGHKPGHAGHKVLAHLERHGPSDATSLLQAAGLTYGTARARKFPRLLRAMVCDGMLRRCQAGFTITHEGAYALDILNSGKPLGEAPQPSVRVFASP